MAVTVQIEIRINSPEFNKKQLNHIQRKSNFISVYCGI